MLVHSGTFHYLLAVYEDSDWEMKEYEKYKDLTPGVTLTSVEYAFEDASYDYGVLDLYVIEDSDGAEWGKKMYRAVGKHADYHNIYQEWSSDSEKLIPFKRLSTRSVLQYYFPDNT